VDLVWIGSASTLQGLERLVPILERLGQAIPGLRLKLICDRFLHLVQLPVVEIPWSEEEEIPALLSADVGISWIPDDLWSRGKCGLKVLQYMAARLPVVCNPVGVQAEMVRPGETGFLVRSEREWLSAIDRLAREPEARRKMGASGRLWVEAEYSVEVGARQWLEVIEQLEGRRSGLRTG
jgi:glycosyltransferase involved in cell wall biosynthesis